MRTTKYKDNSVDYLEFMFTNKNVGITNKKFWYRNKFNVFTII